MLAVLSIDAVECGVGLPLPSLGGIGNEGRSLGEGLLGLGNER